MALFKFGDINQLDDHSCMWKLTMSTDSTFSHLVYTSHFRYENHFWSVSLSQTHDPFTEYVMNCYAKAPRDQKETSRLSQQYKVSIVDDSSQEMWSSRTVNGLFGLLCPLLVPNSIMSNVNDRLKQGKDCFVKLDIIQKGETKPEAADSERATGPQLEYEEESKTEAADSERATGPLLEYEDTGALVEAVKELLLDEDDFDVTFSVQGREFKAHKIFLKVRSPVFKRMFAHDMLEKSGRIEIEDCDPDVFTLFHRFLYTGKADGLTEKNVASLYHLSDKYDVPSLCRMCVLFIENNFDVEEFGDFAEIACVNKEAEEDLFAAAVQFFAKNLEEIADTAKWKAFMRENTEGASELIKAHHRLTLRLNK